jgi:hypothetical protein
MWGCRWLFLGVAVFSGCTGGSGQDPSDIELGDTALVVVVNPAVKDINSAAVTAPGAQRVGVQVSIGGGQPEATDSRGLAVLEKLDGGSFPLTVGGATQSVTITSGELRELAVAQSGASLKTMADVRYDFDGDGLPPAREGGGTVGAALEGDRLARQVFLRVTQA